MTCTGTLRVALSRDLGQLIVVFVCPAIRLSNLYLTKDCNERPGTCYSAAYMSQTCDQKRFYNLRSFSLLARANDTAAHHAAIR